MLIKQGSYVGISTLNDGDALVELNKTLDCKGIYYPAKLCGTKR
jgi:hypothetical protein